MDQLRIIPCPPERAESLSTAIAKLLVQFAREGRCAAHQVAPVADGHAVAVRWDGPALSGCSHDKIAQATAAIAGSQALDLPPICVRCAGVWRRCDRAGLRALDGDPELVLDPASGEAVPFAGSWAQRLRRP